MQCALCAFQEVLEQVIRLERGVNLLANSAEVRSILVAEYRLQHVLRGTDYKVGTNGGLHDWPDQRESRAVILILYQIQDCLLELERQRPVGHERGVPVSGRTLALRNNKCLSLAAKIGRTRNPIIKPFAHV